MEAHSASEVKYFSHLLRRAVSASRRTAGGRPLCSRLYWREPLYSLPCGTCCFPHAFPDVLDNTRLQTTAPRTTGSLTAASSVGRKPDPSSDGTGPPSDSVALVRRWLAGADTARPRSRLSSHLRSVASAKLTAHYAPPQVSSELPSPRGAPTVQARTP